MSLLVKQTLGRFGTLDTPHKPCSPAPLLSARQNFADPTFSSVGFQLNQTFADLHCAGAGIFQIQPAN